MVLGGLLVQALVGCAADDGGRPSAEQPRPRDVASSHSPEPSGPLYPVRSRVVSHRPFNDLEVWAPAADGEWPVVFAVPGSSGHVTSFDALGPALARQGVVVLATEYHPGRSDEQVTHELECGYRYARRVAGDYGGDLDRPVTTMGYSRGARAVWSGLDERRFGPDGTFGGCLGGGAPRPDVVVAIDGCYYAWGGATYDFPASRLGIGDATMVLVSGQADDVCPVWQSRKAARALEAAGYDTTLATIPGANHFRPVFHDVVDGRRTTVPDDPAGQRTVAAVLTAIRRSG